MRRVLARSACLVAAWLLAVGAPLVAGSAMAQTYPARPITLIVPAAAGGPTDVVSRVLAEGMKEALGVSLVIENRGGASAMIGTLAAARAPKDGYTLLMATASSFGTSPHVFKSIKYKIQDFASISMVGNAPLAFSVHPSLPVKNIQDFITYAKARPGELNYGTSGVGSVLHVAAELMSQEAGIKMRAVPYQGSAPALTDLISGTLDGSMDAAQTSAQYHRDGQIRMLAVFADKRLPQLPDVPTLAEIGFPSVTASTWFVLCAPVGTPEAILNTLNAAVATALSSPAVRARLEESGYIVTPSTRQQARQFVRDESRLWRRVIRKAGIRPI